MGGAMRRKVTDRSLRRWLDTGRPTRVGEAIETDPSVAERLEAMTALERVHTEAIDRLVTPQPDFTDRVSQGVRTRIDNYGTVSLMADLLGLGFHVGQAMLVTDENPDGSRPDSDAS